MIDWQDSVIKSRRCEYCQVDALPLPRYLESGLRPKSAENGPNHSAIETVVIIISYSSGSR